jgi:thiamine biosynthesis protein ThiS
MLRVNYSDHPFRDGMTIKSLLDEKGFVFHRIIVKLNGKVVEDADYAAISLKDGDNVEAVHIFAGG